MKYKRKVDQMSYEAGYKAGYAGKPNRADIRGEDNRDAYNAGYADGVADRQKRQERKATA